MVSSSSLRWKTEQGVLCESWPLCVWGRMGQAHDQGLRGHCPAFPLVSLLIRTHLGAVVFQLRFVTSFASAPSRPGALVPQDEGDRTPWETRSARVGMASGGALRCLWLEARCVLVTGRGWLAFFFFGCTRACGILVPQSGIKPGPTAEETWES